MVLEEVDAVEALVAAATLVLLFGMEGQVSIERFLVGESSLTLGTRLQIVYVYYVVTENKKWLTGVVMLLNKKRKFEARVFLGLAGKLLRG